MKQTNLHATALRTVGVETEWSVANPALVSKCRSPLAHNCRNKDSYSPPTVAGVRFHRNGEESRQAIERNGGASRARTDDLIVANDALSQLSYSPARAETAM